VLKNDEIYIKLFNFFQLSRIYILIIPVTITAPGLLFDLAAVAYIFPKTVPPKIFPCPGLFRTPLIVNTA
jgi:hypothetical protein